MAQFKLSTCLLLRLPLYLIFFFQRIVVSRWKRLAVDFLTDFFFYSKASLKQKLWAYKRGFISERITRYGLTNSNYHLYMSDLFLYKKSSYKNRRLNYLFDDKLASWYSLQPFIQYLPIHYFTIIKMNVRRLFDYDPSKNNIDAIIDLIKEKGKIALKSSRGGHGDGFYLLSFSNNHFFINDTLLTEEDFRRKLLSFEDCTLTDFIQTHSDLKKITGTSSCVIRLVTVYQEKEGAQIVGACIRFASKKSGYVTEREGTIYAGIHLNEGTTFKPMIDVGNILEPCVYHPDSNIEIDNVTIPNWTLIKKQILVVSNYLNNTPYLTYDIITTDNCFKILEINSHGMPRMMQPYYPFFQNKYMRELFLSRI